MEITLFYIPVGNADEAASLGNLAIKEQLAACANVFPVQSVFMWQEVMQEEQEFILVLKTMPHKKKALREFLESNHSYKTPGLLSWNAEVNEAYGEWVNQQVKGDI
ncbi:MAG TPA: divalent-cation tolerance protein CutA [Saprospiraceae bacterium]|nr:divalent-cation tolerance protein CutA [Saprospiraceae bacterium]